MILHNNAAIIPLIGLYSLHNTVYTSCKEYIKKVAKIRYVEHCSYYDGQYSGPETFSTLLIAIFSALLCTISVKRSFQYSSPVIMYRLHTLGLVAQ